MGVKWHQASACRSVSSAVGNEGLSQAPAQALMSGRTSQLDSVATPSPSSRLRPDTGVPLVGCLHRVCGSRRIHLASTGRSAELGECARRGWAALPDPCVEGAFPLFTQSLRQAVLSSQNEATKASSVGC